MTTAQRLSLRLFLEGVEVPVISAVTQSQKNGPAACSIQIPSNDYVLDLKPGTLVHCFFYDLYDGTPAEDLLSVGGAGIRVVQREDGVDPELEGLIPPERLYSTTEEDQIDAVNSKWKLLFGGEVAGVNFQKTPSGRQCVLQCVDWSVYWDKAHQYQVSGYSLGQGGIKAAFTGASTNVFNDFLDGSGDVIMNLMETAPRSYPSLKGTLLGAIVHIIEAIGGVYYGRRSIRGTNDYFSLAEMRLRITQMLGANPFSNRDEVRLLRARGFGSLFRRSMSGLGKSVTIRQILMALQKYIFHEVVPITSPRYIPPLYDPNLPQVETVGIDDDDDTRPLGQAARRLRARAEELKERQSRSDTARNARRQSDRRGGLEQEINRYTRVSSRAAGRARLIGLRTGQTDSLPNLFSLPEVHEAFATAGSQFQAILDENRAGQRPGIFKYTFFAPDNLKAVRTVSILDNIISKMDRVLSSQHRRRVQRRTQQPDPPPRLLTQIYRPDVWMVAPPRCNVIFPELYSSFDYSRNFNQEVTRLLLRTHSAFFGSDILFDGFYMSPSRILGQRNNRHPGRGRIGHEPPNNIDAPARVVRDLLEHELYTGIVPKFERMSDLNLHAIRGGSIEIDGQRVGYAQLAANHIFFQYRFKSRSCNVAGKFNPYLALGFPSVVVDKYKSVIGADAAYDFRTASLLAEAGREGEGEIGPPSEERDRITEANDVRTSELLAALSTSRPNTHFLGTPEAMSHSVSAQSGGSTSVQMNYARTTNEETEFLGDNINYTTRARRRRNVRVTTQVAAREAPVVGARGPRGGRIVEVTDVTSQHTRRQRRLRSTTRTATGQRRYRGGTRLPLYVASRTHTGRRRRGTQVLVGVEQAAASYGPEVVALVGTGGSFQSATADGNSTLVTFLAFEVREELGAYTRETRSLPPEDITFPPWYGEHYRSQNIGGIYSYFFGVGAITDRTVVRAPNGQALSTAGGTDRSVEVPLVRTADGTNTAEDTTQVALPATGDPISRDEEAGEPGEPDIGEVSDRSTIADAVTDIVQIYSRVKHQNYDVHQFLKAYTWRPVASMLDLFGSANLEINDKGEVVRGIEGFHSRAYGDYDDLRQLVSPGDGNRPRTIIGLQTEDTDSDRSRRDQAMAARMDTRKEKREKVLRYMQALLNSEGLVG